MEHGLRSLKLFPLLLSLGDCTAVTVLRNSMAAKSPADLSTSCSALWKCCIDSHSRTGHFISLKFYTFPFPSFLSIGSLKSHSFIG